MGTSRAYSSHSKQAHQNWNFHYSFSMIYRRISSDLRPTSPRIMKLVLILCLYIAYICTGEPRLKSPHHNHDKTDKIEAAPDETAEPKPAKLKRSNALSRLLSRTIEDCGPINCWLRESEVSDWMIKCCPAGADAVECNNYFARRCWGW